MTLPLLLQLEHVFKRFGDVLALEDICLEVTAGESVAITGASGAGKTTLLGILGLLETASSGSYRLRGKAVGELDDLARSSLRNQSFGFVFQQFSLIPSLNAWQNVARPLSYARVPKREQKARAMALLKQLGLEHRADHRPAQLSGGEQQRVAIARALINDPDIILADEPTGNLPKAQWEPILDALEHLHKGGKTLIIVTHNPEVAARASRVLYLYDGRLAPGEATEAGRSTPHTSAQTILLDKPVALKLWFLGGLEVSYRGAGLAITPRQADLLALLAQHPEGLSGEQLLLLTYGEKGKMSTLKAALSRLRAQVPIASQPYRIDENYQADFLQVATLVKEGDLREALERYRGSLLPTSTTPGVSELREHLDESLRQAVIASADADLIFTLAERMGDDLELWETALSALPPDDLRRAIAQSKIVQIRKTW